MKKGKVIVALSGGVDSSVAAALLQKEGWDVEGVFMKNWSPDTSQALEDCPWKQDQEDAQAVCDVLGIPFRSINFEKEYRDKVLNYFFEEYQAGRTPNPDVMCNKEIKFRSFLDYALESGAEKIATGHYARIQHTSNSVLLKRGADPAKDQSYFLWSLSQDQLDKSMFPIGGLRKSEVRTLAVQFGLPTAKKKDSQGICFIGHLDVKDYLKSHISGKPGDVVLLPEYSQSVTWEERTEQGKRVGRHPGVVYFTHGERAGQVTDNRLYRSIRGNVDVAPLFVVEKDMEKNILYVSDDSNDRDLCSYEAYLDGIQWAYTDIELPMVSANDVNDQGLHAQLRYQQTPVSVRSIEHDKGCVVVKLNAPVKAISPGQSLVLYKGDIVVGGGVICRIPRARP